MRANLIASVCGAVLGVAVLVLPAVAFEDPEDPVVPGLLKQKCDSTPCQNLERCDRGLFVCCCLGPAGLTCKCYTSDPGLAKCQTGTQACPPE